MEFNTHLSMDYKEKSYGSARIYDDMVEQAKLADELGFDAVSLTEHHLVNIGMNPAPLMTAVKIADHTKRVKIITAVVVLPLHDMRVYAGEVAMADILTNGRLILGVGRGAYAFEMGRFGIPMEETRERFDESLDVLLKLLREEEVAWTGKHYSFEALTVMPRPMQPGGPAMMMAALAPGGDLCEHQAGLSHPDDAVAWQPPAFPRSGERVPAGAGRDGRRRQAFEADAVAAGHGREERHRPTRESGARRRFLRPLR